MYGIKCPFYKEFRPYWLGYYAHQARRAVCDAYGESWKSLYRKGFRAVKIKITEINP